VAGSEKIWPSEEFPGGEIQAVLRKAKASTNANIQYIKLSKKLTGH
jgi:hypothetical protein